MALNNEESLNDRTRILRKMSDMLLPLSIFLLMFVLLFGVIFRLSNKTELTGVTLAELPEESSDGIVDGTYQSGWDSWLKDNFWGHTAVVKLHNQMQYSLFRDGNGDWGVGKDFMIYKKSDASVYAVLGKSGETAQWRFDAYARKLAHLQEQLEAAGKDFVYLLSPMKVELYAEYLPWNLRVLAEKYKGIGTNYRDMLVQALEKYGVHYYDMTADMRRMLQTADYEVISKTGHHWTLTAVANEMNTLFDGISPMAPHTDLPRVDVTGMTESLYGTDVDILNDENVYWGVKSEHYYTPDITYSKQSDNSVYLFGTSMSLTIYDALVRDETNRAFDELSYLEYFTYLARADENGRTGHAYEPGDPPSALHVMEGIRDSDLIMIEQVDQSGIFETHERFVKYVDQYADKVYYTMGDDLINYTENMAGGVLEGFHQLEPNWRWATGDAKVTVYGNALADAGSDVKLKMTMCSYEVDQPVEVTVNGMTLETLQVAPMPQIGEYEVTIPKELLKPDENHIELTAQNKVYSPKELGLSDDDIRRIAMGFSSLTLEVDA